MKVNCADSQKSKFVKTKQYMWTARYHSLLQFFAVISWKLPTPEDLMKNQGGPVPCIKEPVQAGSLSHYLQGLMHPGATHDPPALQPSARISGPAESASGSASGSADVGGRLEGTWVATAGRADSPQEAAPCDQMRGAQETGRKALPKEKWAAVIFAKRFLRYPPLNYQHSSHEARFKGLWCVAWESAC